MRRIESRQNALVKYWRKLVTNKKERDQQREFIVEGFHLVEEALQKKGVVLHLIVREGVTIPTEWKEQSIQLIEVPPAIAQELDDTEHSQGVYAHCIQPSFQQDAMEQWTKLLFIDAVQDPGNVGTMLRTADAAGMDAVILGKGCADPYNPKVVRSAQGAHFHLPILKGDLQSWMNTVQQKGHPVIGTGFAGAVDYRSIQTPTAFALLVGNEGSGVDPAYLAGADHIVKIPLYGQAESLNVAVATGILLYHYC